ncbi:uncharacterized protein LOC131250655 [Magnolia sinica]|uniref:uncharacterized protein LOC131250655 n=1 Tax=Magnolia sinica TaxID=86752 RepID=UPI00265B23DC|nr:uncharacterized protein LOC131250655 [Magnolia sinica]
MRPALNSVEVTGYDNYRLQDHQEEDQDPLDLGDVEGRIQVVGTDNHAIEQATPSQLDGQIIPGTGKVTKKLRRHRILYARGDWGSRLRRLKRRANFTSPPYITFVYARCARILRRALWEELASFSSLVQGPWAVCGDFNATLDNSKRRSRRPADKASSSDFAEAINNAGLLDLGFSGNRFTWSNNQARSSRVWARLDRVLINVAWSTLFLPFQVTHLPCIQSDHAPLLLVFPARTTSGPKPFRFQQMWAQHDLFSQVVRSAWNKAESTHPVYNVLSKLEQVKHDLRIWNKEIFRNVFEKVRVVERSLVDLETQLQDAPEIFWKQKSMVNWLAEGDRNTRFFHAVATEKQRRSAQNDVLLALPTLSEVHHVVLSMPKDGDPGSNGFPRSFYAWEVVGQDIHKAVTFFFQGGNLHRAVTSSVICLIPKSNSPKRFLNFRPISLCNCLYKIFSKIIAIRLSQVLPLLISSKQGAFI